MKSPFFTRLSILFFFPLMSIGQEIQLTGNYLFDLLNKPVNSPDVKKLDEFYDMDIKDNTTRHSYSKGIEYQLKNDKIKKIVLHNTGGDWSSYSYELPLGIQWNMKESGVVKLLGPKENGLPYHYDKNLDINPVYEGDEKKLASIELKFTDYFETDTKEKDDDALLALFLSDPNKFIYLKQGATQKVNSPDMFDKNRFKKQLNDIIQIFADKKTDRLKGGFLSETKSNNSTVKYYASVQPVSNVVNQYMEQKEILNELNYIIVLDEIKSVQAEIFPAAVLHKYNYWLEIIKELLTAPWTFENAEVYEGILDRGVTFENKTGLTTSGGFTYYKYPLIDLYIVYKKDHYSVELNIY